MGRTTFLLLEGESYRFRQSLEQQAALPPLAATPLRIVPRWPISQHRTADILVLGQTRCRAPRLHPRCPLVLRALSAPQDVAE